MTSGGQYSSFIAVSGMAILAIAMVEFLRLLVLDFQMTTIKGIYVSISVLSVFHSVLLRSIIFFFVSCSRRVFAVD